MFWRDLISHTTKQVHWLDRRAVTAGVILLLLPVTLWQGGLWRPAASSGQLAGPCSMRPFSGTSLTSPMLMRDSVGSCFFLSVTFASTACRHLVGKVAGSYGSDRNTGRSRKWAAATGGLLGAVVWGILFNMALELRHPLTVGIGSAILGISGQLGGLFGSRLKQMVGNKDSGELSPVSGGVLDRMYSLTWNVVVLYHMVALTTMSCISIS